MKLRLLAKKKVAKQGWSGVKRLVGRIRHRFCSHSGQGKLTCYKKQILGLKQLDSDPGEPIKKGFGKALTASSFLQDIAHNLNG